MSEHEQPSAQASTFTEQDARTILEMMEVCFNEGIGPDWDQMIAEIKRQHPKLAEEYAAKIAWPREI